jgi:hypothetical protein
VRRLALLCIGEIGRSADLSAFPQLQPALTGALSSPSEDTKSAAALALGGVAIGNMDTYVPFIIQQIDEQARRRGSWDRLYFCTDHACKSAVVPGHARSTSAGCPGIRMRDVGEPAGLGVVLLHFAGGSSSKPPLMRLLLLLCRLRTQRTSTCC